MTRLHVATVLAVLFLGSQASADPQESPPGEPAYEAQKSDTDVAVDAGNVESVPVRVASAAPSMVDPVAPVAPVAPLPPPPPTGLAAFAETDAAAGHAYVSPTAITGARGHGGLTLWAPAVPVLAAGFVTFSVHDRLEIGAGGVAIFEEDEAALALNAKLQLVRGRTGAIAVQLIHVRPPEGEDDSLTMVSAVGSKCLDAACRTLGSLHVTAVPMERYVADAYGPEDVLVFWGGGSLVTGGRVKVVLDALVIDDGSYEPDRVLITYAGLRLARRGWALDGGLALAFDGDEIEPAPTPLLGLSARF